ncbi:TPA: phosphate uptake regulator PhoU [Candidatus Woesearchaeota archaeon]|nr:phosphate uptake regulator PhoU [Candidatus Woesearchaeota archaeon]
MKRKINRVGPSTLTVSLPSKWAKTLGLKAGDEIEVEERANQLVLSRERTIEKKDITIHYPSKQRFLKRFLVSAYIKGYDTIQVTYDDPVLFGLVQETMNKLLLGFEVVEHSKDRCVLKNIAEGMEYEFDNTQRKYFLHIKQLLSHLIEAIQNKDPQELEHLLFVDQTVDKLCQFIRRMLNIHGYKDDSKGKSLYFIDNLLESIADHCRDIAKHMQRTGIYPSSDFLVLLKQVAQNIETYYQLFYTFNREKLVDLKERDVQIKKSVLEQIEKHEHQHFLFYHHLLGMTEICHDLSEEMG